MREHVFKTPPTGRPSSRFCGRRLSRRPREGRPGLRSGTPRRCEVQPSNSGIPLHHRCGGAAPNPGTWRRKTHRMMRRCGSSRSGAKEKRGGDRRPRSWARRLSNSRYSPPCSPSWPLQKVWRRLSFVFPLHVIFIVIFFVISLAWRALHLGTSLDGGQR